MQESCIHPPGIRSCAWPALALQLPGRAPRGGDAAQRGQTETGPGSAQLEHGRDLRLLYSSKEALENTSRPRRCVASSELPAIIACYCCSHYPSYTRNHSAPSRHAWTSHLLSSHKRNGPSGQCTWGALPEGQPISLDCDPRGSESVYIGSHETFPGGWHHDASRHVRPGACC